MKNIKNISVIGTGVIGTGWILRFLACNKKVTAFDKNKNRLGYGKGFYDKYLNKYVRKNKKILTIGVAFSFQKHHKLPTNDFDFTLDFIITDKGEI